MAGVFKASLDGVVGVLISFCSITKVTTENRAPPRTRQHYSPIVPPTVPASRNLARRSPGTIRRLPAQPATNWPMRASVSDIRVSFCQPMASVSFQDLVEAGAAWRYASFGQFDP